MPRLEDLRRYVASPPGDGLLATPSLTHVVSPRTSRDRNVKADEVLRISVYLARRVSRISYSRI